MGEGKGNENGIVCTKEGKSMDVCDALMPGEGFLPSLMEHEATAQEGERQDTDVRAEGIDNHPVGVWGGVPEWGSPSENDENDENAQSESRGRGTNEEVHFEIKTVDMSRIAEKLQAMAIARKGAIRKCPKLAKRKLTPAPPGLR